LGLLKNQWWRTKFYRDYFKKPVRKPTFYKNKRKLIARTVDADVSPSSKSLSFFAHIIKKM
jgi:hypothetical protein